jgi:hypothetical protein
MTNAHQCHWDSAYPLSLSIVHRHPRDPHARNFVHVRGAEACRTHQPRRAWNAKSERVRDLPRGSPTSSLFKHVQPLFSHVETCVHPSEPWDWTYINDITNKLTGQLHQLWAFWPPSHNGATGHNRSQQSDLERDITPDPSGGHHMSMFNTLVTSSKVGLLYSKRIY